MEKRYHFITRVEFWLILYFIIRLYGILNPPLEVGHNWRQTTVTMVARNFLEIDNNILYPRVDIAGEKTGITGMEFPVLNYGIYLMSEVFGYEHWYGRLINLIITTIGIFFFYRLLSIFLKKPASLYAAITLLGGSIWFTFSRKIMPDTFAVSLVIIGGYYGVKYLFDKASIKNVGLYTIFILIGTLAKLPAGFLLAFFILPMLHGQIEFTRKLYFTLVSIACVILVGMWYFYWSPFLTSHYGFWHFYMGTSLLNGVKQVFENFPQATWRFVSSACGISGFILATWGFIRAWRRNNRPLFYTVLLLFLTFSVLIFKAGFAFYHHDYYIIPYVPVMAALIGYALAGIRKKKYIIMLLGVLILENTLTRMKDFSISDKRKWPLQLEAFLDKHTEKDDLIAINSGEYPTLMYFAHRKGWVKEGEELLKSDYLLELRKKGCKYLIWVKEYEEGRPNLQKIEEAERYILYKF